MRLLGLGRALTLRHKRTDKRKRKKKKEKKSRRHSAGNTPSDKEHTAQKQRQDTKKEEQKGRKTTTGPEMPLQTKNVSPLHPQDTAPTLQFGVRRHAAINQSTNQSTRHAGETPVPSRHRSPTSTTACPRRYVQKANTQGLQTKAVDNERNGAWETSRERQLTPRANYTLCGRQPMNAIVRSMHRAVRSNPTTDSRRVSASEPIHRR